MKILIITNNIDEDEQIKRKISSTIPRNIHVVVHTKKSNESVIKNLTVDYDLVFIGEDVSYSAWGIIDAISNRALNKKPRFYLMGNIELVLDKELKCASFSGAVSLSLNGHLLVRQGYGSKNRSQLQCSENRPETLFNIGSTGKMIFTSMAITQLIKSGKLSYDKPIGDSLEELSSCPERHKQIFKELTFTPRQLLTHTSGLDDMMGKVTEMFVGPKMLSFTEMSDFVDGCAELETQQLTTLGCFEYSNFGYYLLGLAIEAITDDYYDYIQINILNIANMKNTVCEITSGVNFANPYIGECSLLPNEVPDWLIDMESGNQDLELQQIIKISLEIFPKLKISYNNVYQLYTSYQHVLSMDSEIDFSMAKSKFARDIEAVYRTMDAYVEMFFEIVKLCEGLESKHKMLFDFMKCLLSNLDWQISSIECFINSLSKGHSAGCWYSTIDDLMAFHQSLESGALSEYKDHFTEYRVKVPGAPRSVFYGHGCEVNSNPNDYQYCYGHGGSVPGSHAKYYNYPNAGYTLVVLGNTDARNCCDLKAMLEEKLIFSRINGIRYFDQRICPNPGDLLLQDVEYILRRTQEHEYYKTLFYGTMPRMTLFQQLDDQYVQEHRHENPVNNNEEEGESELPVAYERAQSPK